MRNKKIKRLKNRLNYLINNLNFLIKTFYFNKLKSCENFVYSDGGRRKSKSPGEYNDCTVRALSIALNEDYDKVHDFFYKNGRKYRQGVFFETIIKRYNKKRKLIFGHKVYKIPNQYITIKNFLFHNREKESIFLITSEAHIICIKNNRVYDLSPSFQYCETDNIIMDAFQVEKVK